MPARLKSFFLTLIALGGLVACGPAPKEYNGQIDAAHIYDPHEGLNRKIFAFNNFIDTYGLEPITQAYDFITPNVVRLLISNELDYLQSPVSIINSALQGNLESFLHTSGRFFINTTFGGLGLLDAASSFGLGPHQEDFGQTLALWGMPYGGYHITPFLGPSTWRHLSGRLVDRAFTPMTYIGDDIVTLNMADTALGVIEFRASNAEIINSLRKTSSDYYAAVRTIYMQQRMAAIKNTQLHPKMEQQQEIVDFDDF